VRCHQEGVEGEATIMQRSPQARQAVIQSEPKATEGSGRLPEGLFAADDARAMLD
jgi:hypothetical protein